MGKLSRLKMLGSKYLDRVNLKKQVEERLKTVTEPVKNEARANTLNFMAWWAKAYPDEFNKVEVETRLNKNKRVNVPLTLKRMDEWRKSLTYV